jgi:hypothetical protein
VTTRLLLAVLSLVVMMGVAPGLASADSGASSSPPVQGRQRVSATDVSSSNWSGYAASGAFTTVSGTWTQPQATCDRGGNAFAAFFVGLDGYNSSTVEQIGTDADCSHGTAVYYAWFEMYPNPATLIDTCTINPGDTVSASVTYVGNSTFHLTMTVVNDSQTPCFDDPNVVAPGTTPPDLSSAEWIAEAPATGNHLWPLTNFDTVTFDNATADGTNLGSLNPDKITMVKQRGPFNTTDKAVPSDLIGGDGFTVTWASA